MVGILAAGGLARRVAAARDRDLADLGIKVDANRSTLNAHAEQTAARFDRLEREMRDGFAEMRGKLDQSAAGQQQIAQMLPTLIDRVG